MEGVWADYLQNKGSGLSIRLPKGVEEKAERNNYNSLLLTYFVCLSLLGSIFQIPQL